MYVKVLSHFNSLQLFQRIQNQQKLFLFYNDIDLLLKDIFVVLSVLFANSEVNCAGKKRFVSWHSILHPSPVRDTKFSHKGQNVIPIAQRYIFLEEYKPKIDAS
jgi:hypothetical protein